MSRHPRFDFSFAGFFFRIQANCRHVLSLVWRRVFILRLFLQGPVWVGIRVLIFPFAGFFFRIQANCRHVSSQVWKCVFSLRLFLQDLVWVGIRVLIFSVAGFFLSNPSKL